MSAEDSKSKTLYSGVSSFKYDGKNYDIIYSYINKKHGVYLNFDDNNIIIPCKYTSIYYIEEVNMCLCQKKYINQYYNYDDWCFIDLKNNYNTTDVKKYIDEIYKKNAHNYLNNMWLFINFFNEEGFNNGKEKAISYKEKYITNNIFNYNEDEIKEMTENLDIIIKYKK